MIYNTNNIYKLNNMMTYKTNNNYKLINMMI